ncbi:MAG: extracellular solute-binding protein [Lapillicoccus sp.]
MPPTARTLPRLVAGAAAATLLLAACSGGGGTTGSSGSSGSNADAVSKVTDDQLKGTTIQIARFFGDCTADVGTSTDLTKAVGECPTIQTLTNKFNAENKWGIKVERLGGAAWDSYYDALNAAFAGGNPPDVAIMHGSSLVDYGKRGLLVPLDDLLPIAKTDVTDAVPAAQTAIKYKDKIYAVPFDVHAALAHLNVDLFTQAGLVNADGTPKMPKTADEMLTDAKTLKDKTGKNYLAVPRSGDNLGSHLVNSLIMQQGSSVLSTDLTKGNLDTPEAKKAVEFENAMVTGGFMDGKQTYDAAGQSFLKADVAMLFNGTWVVDTYNKDAKFKYEATNFPTLYAQPAVWADSHTWTIPVHKDADPVKERAALEFINYLYQNDAAWALGTGHISSRTSVLKSSAYAAAPQRKNYADTGLTVAHPVPHIANWPAIQKILVQSVEANWFQSVPVDKALKDGNASINAALKQ